MADAVVSAMVGQIVDLLATQARFHINLVKGAEKEVHKLSVNLETIRLVLDDAEHRRFTNPLVDHWLSRLEHTSREIEDVLDEWRYAMLKLEVKKIVARSKKNLVSSFFPSSSCLCFKEAVVRHDIANKILSVKAELDDVLKEMNKFEFLKAQPISHKSFRDPSTSFTDLVQIKGRDSNRDTLVTKLTGRQEELESMRVVSIVGVGGIGKTTLAQLVYADSLVEQFFDLKIWVCVSDPFDLTAIAKRIIKSITKRDPPSTNDLDILLQSVRDSIMGKIFLLVLDDVWTEDPMKWDPLKTSLKCAGAGSKILITTRSEKVAQIVGTIENDIHHPEELSDDNCWLLMRHLALSESGQTESGNMEFELVGKKIAKKCNGLPLAAKTLGSLLRFKKTLEEWKNVLDSEIWQLEEAKTNIFPHLLLSYNELSPTLKRCFSYCAVFPKDCEINVDDLIRNWMAIGYLGSDIGNMELKGWECFDILAMRSLFQDFEKDELDEKIESCKMHDIVHDFAQFIRKSGKVEATQMNRIACQTCDAILVSSVNEFCTLFFKYEEFPLNLCYCLKRLRVLSLGECDLESISQGIENMIHLRYLSLYKIQQLSPKTLKIIFQLYNLQTLSLLHCNLEEIPKEIGNLIQLRCFHLCLNKSLKELPREIENLIQLRYLDLSWNESLKELPREIGNLIQLRHLNLSSNESLKELPREIGNLIQLRHLDLRSNKSLKELPREIGNLIQLSHLDLSWNEPLKELPMEIGNLIQLKHLDLSWNKSLKELPESICALNLLTLDVEGCSNLSRLPEGVGQLISLRSLSEFEGGSGGNKLRSLKNLNHLSGSLTLTIKLDNDINSEEIVEDAEEAQLKNKIHIQTLNIWFKDEMDENEERSMLRMKVIDALEPHPKLDELQIFFYEGPQLGVRWLVSPLNQLRKLTFECHDHLTSLPPLGKLPCLEILHINEMGILERVGGELLGIGRGDRELHTVAFPKLKELTFWECESWKEWEDITAEEEESAALTLMPCLTKLEINDCNELTTLPHRLLRKVSSLQVLDISCSKRLQQRYREKDGSDWKSISQYNPCLQLNVDN